MAEKDPGNEIPSTKDGLVKIEDGKLYIQDPTGLGRYPRIKPGENIRLYIDNQLVDKEIIVSETNQEKIDWEIIPSSDRKNLDIEITEDKLKAYLAIELVPSRKLKVKDTGPANSIKISTKVIEEKYPEITREEIVDFLHDNNILYGIKQEKIDKIIKDQKNENYQKVLIAEGKDCQEGEDARVIESEAYRAHGKELFNTIDSFARGEVICYKKDPVPGRKGIDVTGSTIKEPPVNDIKLKAGKKVKLSEDGKKAISLENGQPKIIRKNGVVTVSIVEQYVIDGDVDKITGNLKYKGDLLIKGSITDYFNVQVGHDLKVGGNIAHSQVITQGDVHVKNNIISSEINVGHYLPPQLENNLKKIINGIEDLCSALEQINGEARQRDIKLRNMKIGKILKLLFLNKFSNLRSVIKETFQKIDDKYEKLNNIFNKIIPYMKNLGKLENVTDEMIFMNFKKDLESMLENYHMEKRKLNIHAGYIQNSTIDISGSVIINKDGCYNSEINSGECIVVKGKRGFLRGGNYQAQGLIYARKAGSKLSTTYLDVNTRIYIGQSEGSLIISSPADKRKIDKGRRNINYEVNEYGKLKSVNTNPKSGNWCEIK